MIALTNTMHLHRHFYLYPLQAPEEPWFDPVSRAGWYAGIRKGLYPAPVKLSERVAAWPLEDIRTLIDRHNH